MKFIILVSVALLAVASATDEVQILRSESSADPDGSYEYAFETSDGTVAEQRGRIKNKGTENEALDVQGHYSYKSDDGTQINTVYIANENGFQAQGDHIPVPPKIPKLIQRALKYLAEHPPKDE